MITNKNDKTLKSVDFVATVLGWDDEVEYILRDRAGISAICTRTMCTSYRFYICEIE